MGTSMSLREHRKSVVGSTIGAPTGGFWSSMAIPPSRPFSWAFEPVQTDAASMSAERICITAPADDDDDESPILERVTPLWLHDLSDPGTALVLFDEASTSEIVPLQSAPRRLRVREPVSIRKIEAASLSWQPLVEDGAEVGFVYMLGNNGARIEVRIPGSVTVVQSDYSPLCASTGMCAPSSLLVFADEAHLESLRCLQTQLEHGEDIGYVPSRELCVTHSFDKIVMRANGGESGERNDAARRTWIQTKSFMKRLSCLTADCITRHNENEISRARAFELSHSSGLWHGSVI